MTTAVWKGRYEFTVIERGIVECASSTEIRCQVRSRGGTTTILDVVPEGSFVQVGDMVVELDASNQLLEENAQKILIATRESQLSQAENTLQAAKVARTEYLQGLYIAQEAAFSSALFMAERGKSTAEAALESAKALHREGIFTALQVEAAYAGLEDAINKFDAADNALQTLRNLTKQKELTLLGANIASAEANFHAQRLSLRMEQERLQFIQEQIANCTIKATAPGQVVYANETDSYRSSSQSQFIVAPGATVRERQTIIWLPNPHDMQVKAAVNEAHITTIRPGMPVSIRVAALPNDLIEGSVTRVSQYAEPSYSTGNIRKYATIIKIKNPPAELRVGMNAEVHMHVERTVNALQVPVQALAESNGRFFSLVEQGDRYETREITISSTNDIVATVASGLEEGDEVIMNPRSTGSLLELPSLDPPSFAMDEIKRADLDVSTLPRKAENGLGRKDGGTASVSDVKPADLVAQFLKNDANNDDKLSREEISKMEGSLRQRLATADTNGDGLLERRELLRVSANAPQPPRKESNSHPAAGPDEDGGRNRSKQVSPGEEIAGG